MKVLMKSRQFWVVVLDFVFSVVLFFVGKYTTPSTFEDIKFLIGVIQPVALVLVAAFTIDDVSVRNLEARVKEAEIWYRLETRCQDEAEDCCEEKKVDCCEHCD